MGQPLYANGPLLFRDEARPPRTDFVAPPERSDEALAKEHGRRRPMAPGGSFATLMGEFGCLTRYRVVPARLGAEAPLELPSEPTPLRPRPSSSPGSHPRAY